MTAPDCPHINVNLKKCDCPHGGKAQVVTHYVVTRVRRANDTPEYRLESGRWSSRKLDPTTARIHTKYTSAERECWRLNQRARRFSRYMYGVLAVAMKP